MSARSLSGASLMLDDGGILVSGPRTVGTSHSVHSNVKGMIAASCITLIFPFSRRVFVCCISSQPNAKNMCASSVFYPCGSKDGPGMFNMLLVTHGATPISYRPPIPLS